MISKTFRLPLSCSIIVCLVIAILFAETVPARADDRPPLDRLYIAHHTVLMTDLDRQLTHDENVSSVSPNPLGTRIAYVAVAGGPDSTGDDLYTIGLVKHEVRQYTDRLNLPIAATFNFGAGWSPDGRFLSLTAFTTDSGFKRYLPVLDMTSAKTSDPCRIIGDDSALVEVDPGSWGPADRLALRIRSGKQWSVGVYDALKGKLAVWPVDSTYVRDLRWQDAGHVLFTSRSKEQAENQYSIDVATGKTGAVEGGQTTWSAFELSTMDRITLPDGFATLDLSLETSSGPAISVDGGLHSKVTSVWLRVQGLPPMPKKRPDVAFLLVDSLLGNPNSESIYPVFIPHSSLASTIQAVFVADGNIYLSTIVFDKSTAYETTAAGEILTCQEEEELAIENAKQIGLGALQYCQDNDERLPDGDSFHDEVYPYIKDESVFRSDGKYAFKYEMNGDTLASIDSPADTEEGCFTLPCGKVVLFADGHVKLFPVQEGAETFPGWPKKGFTGTGG